MDNLAMIKKLSLGITKFKAFILQEKNECWRETNVFNTQREDGAGAEILPWNFGFHYVIK